MKTEQYIQSWMHSAAPRLSTMLQRMLGEAEFFGQPSQWLSSIIDLMAPLGHNERAVRTALFRGAARHDVRVQRHGRRSLCMLAAHTSAAGKSERLRLNHPPARDFSEDWTILVNSGGISAAKYAATREELHAIEYCRLAPNILARPASYRYVTPANGAEDQHGLAAFDISGAQLAAAARQPLFGSADRDLAASLVSYRQFLAGFSPLRDALYTHGAISDRQAYLIRMLVGEAYAHCRAIDPLLPQEWLPENWPGMAAYQAYVALHCGCAEQTQRHMRQVIAASANDMPAADVTHFRPPTAAPMARLSA